MNESNVTNHLTFVIYRVKRQESNRKAANSFFNSSVTPFLDNHSHSILRNLSRALTVIF